MNSIDQLIKQHCPNGVPFKQLGEVASLKKGKSITKKQIHPGNIPVVAGGMSAAYYHNEFNQSGETIVVAGSGANAGFVSWWSEPIFVSDAFSIKADAEILNPRYCFHYLKKEQRWLHGLKRGGGVPHVYAKDASKLIIPIPSLEVQQQIVEILDSFTQLEAELEAELETGKKRFEYYRHELLQFPSEETPCTSVSMTIERLIQQHCPGGVSRVRLDEVVEYEQPTKYLVKSKDYSDSFATPVLTAGKSFFLGKTDEEHGVKTASPTEPVIIFDDFTTSFQWVDFSFKVKSSALKILTAKTDTLDIRFLFHIMHTIGYPVMDHSRQWISRYSKQTIPLPPLEIQRKIVETLDTFTDLDKELETELTARRQQYEYYRDQLLTFEELDA